MLVENRKYFFARRQQVRDLDHEGLGLLTKPDRPFPISRAESATPQANEHAR